MTKKTRRKIDAALKVKIALEAVREHGQFPTNKPVQAVPLRGSISKGTPRDCIFGNKAREDRVSCVAPQFGARWSRLAPAGNVTCPKKALTIVDRD